MKHLTICVRGVHASWRALHALQYFGWENAAACLGRRPAPVREGK